MSQHQPSHDLERLHDLLADRATFGLSPVEAQELDLLLARHSQVDADEYDRLAAAIDLALEPAVHHPLPPALRAKIASGVKVAADRAVNSGALDRPQSPLFTVERAAPPAAPISTWLGWLTAAACLLVAALVWSLNQPGVPPNADVAMRALLEQPGTVQTPLAAPDAVPGVTGDVVWNEREQRGFMRLRGLAVNDPKLRQYQLWIFAKNQDDRYPVDGGVFDVGRDGEVVVPIKAAIRVLDPTMYAITVEKPGGVVVSDREKIVLLGKVSG
jgi:hypothetical protein